MSDDYLAQKVVWSEVIVVPYLERKHRHTSHECQSVWLQHKYESFIPLWVQGGLQDTSACLERAEGNFTERI